MTGSPTETRTGTPRPEAKGPGPGKAVAIRLVAAPVILAVVIGVLVLQHETGNPIGTDLLLLVLAAGGAAELARLFRHEDDRVSILVPVLAAAALGGIGLYANADLLGAPTDEAARMTVRVLVVLGSLLVLALARLGHVGTGALHTIPLSLVPVVYVGLAFSFMRELLDGEAGALRCLFVVLVAKGSDIGAWLVGKPFGRHKLAPSISPGKSWEGLAGGLLLGILAAVFLPGPLGLAEGDWSVPARVGFGLLLGVVSLFAGLTQSGWKRRVGAKDSSTLIPEMGGVLDMIDSLLLAGPTAWLVLRLSGVI